MARVFISYRENETIVRKLSRDIESLGHTVWQDQSLTSDQAWWDYVLAALRDCSLFALVLSPEWLNSAVCKREYSHAVELGKPVLLIRVSDRVSNDLVPPALSRIEFVDYRKPGRDARRVLARALRTVDLTGPSPDPLSQPLTMPVGSRAVRRDSVNSKLTLTYEEQAVLLPPLISGLRVSEMTEESRTLLKKLRSRPDVSARIVDEIDEALTDAAKVEAEDTSSFVNSKTGDRARRPTFGQPKSPRKRKPGGSLPEDDLARGVRDTSRAGGRVDDRASKSVIETAHETETQTVDNVDATVYAPNQAAPHDNFLVLVYAHLPEQAAAVEEEARAVAPTVKKRLRRKLDQKITRGATLRFDLGMPGLGIDEPSQSLVWQGEHDSVQFSVSVPLDSQPRTIVGTVIVSRGTVPVGHLKFTLGIVGDSAAALSPQPVQAGSLTRYQCAFISYASQDRAEVLKRVQMLKASKVNFFQDLLTLEPGDRWEKLIYEYIDRSDVFFLFWSKAASRSRWVRKEIKYAKARKLGNDQMPPEFVPVIIEGPPPAKPPKELSFLHFNDRFMYFIKGEEDMR